MKGGKMLRTALLLIVMGQLSGTVADSLNRTLVEMPAWQQVGAEAWAAFSVRADLGNGRTLYPLAGIGGTVLILGAAIAFPLNPRRPWSVAIPLYAGALMVVCVMLTTTQAAPIMLSLHRIGSDLQDCTKPSNVFIDGIRSEPSSEHWRAAPRYWHWWRFFPYRLGIEWKRAKTSARPRNREQHCASIVGARSVEG